MPVCRLQNINFLVSEYTDTGNYSYAVSILAGNRHHAEMLVGTKLVITNKAGIKLI